MNVTSRTRGLLAALVLAATLAPSAVRAEGPEPVDLEGLASVLVQHEGRVKPLDSFARHYALMVAQRKSVQGMPALAWLAELTTRPGAGGERPLFKIRTPEVLTTLGLTADPSGYYSLDAVVGGIRAQLPTMQALYAKDRKQRSPAEEQLADIFESAQQILDVQASLTGVRRVFKIDDVDLAQALGVAPGTFVSYRVLGTQRQTLAKLLEITAQDAESPRHKALRELGMGFASLDQDSRASLFAVIPPTDAPEDRRWSTPWEIITRGGQPWQEALVAELENAVAAIDRGDQAAFDRHIALFQASVRTHVKEDVMGDSVAHLEVTYNRADPFKWSLIFYVLAFLLVAFGWIGWRERLRQVATGALVVGVALHLAGVVMRIIIMERPPVSNLYESVVFVGLIGAAAGLWLEWSRRNGLGILAGTVTGAALHFLGFSYASEGDTMGMLVAVLDSNFWLATHVLTITIGYGAVVIASVIGHVYLIQRYFFPKDQAKLSATLRNGVGLSLVALFFAVLGTILGGIWADQSWGRFWGWDPKENGALLICLWMLVLLHGRVAAILRDLGFAVGLVLANITVALAWFGVNLLSVGLHSYGFASGVAIGLLIFCVAEVVFGVTFYFLIKNREKNGGLARNGGAGARLAESKS